jgi:hypothetical protein
MDVGVEKVSSDLVPFFVQSLKGGDGTVGATDVKQDFHSEEKRINPIQRGISLICR